MKALADVRERWVDEKLGRLDLAQKVGQMMVFGFCGPIVTPDVVELIRRYHVGGLRVTTKFRGLTMLSDLPAGAELPEFKRRSLRYPTGLSRDFAHHAPPISATPAQYASTLNRLREISMERAGGVPLHYALDQEGNAVDDLVLGQKFFPHPMGLAATGDEKLVERCALAVGRQCRAVGANMIHSPVLDVNTNPNNPEVGTRAYSDDADTTIRFASATLRGFSAAGLVATGKHFPGRGDSESDAHHGLPSVGADEATMRAIHLRPFAELIRLGLTAVMTAHSLYPRLGVTDRPASASRRILEDLLRGELGFEGVVETDNMMMGGILQKWDLCEAVLQVIEAGSDLILLRDESPVRIEVIEALIAAVRSGRIKESRIDASVRRILGMRHDMGLADGGLVDAARAGDPIDDPATVEAAREAAEQSVIILRDRRGLLPVDPHSRILLVEQIFPAHLHANNFYSHPGLLWEMLSEVAGQVSCVEIPYAPGRHDLDRVRRRLEAGEFDIVVATSWYYHKDGQAGTGALELLRACGRPLVAITNSPYPFAVPGWLDTVLTVFHPGAPEHLRAAAAVIFGNLVPSATLPVNLT